MYDQLSIEKPAKAKPVKKPSGFVFYRGPSLLDNKPIVGIAIVAKSSNSKTGNLVQTYILADNGINPLLNAQAGSDDSICGDCKHRRYSGGACYVNLGQGPNQVFKALARGSYPHDTEALKKAIQGRVVRLGSYGDPAAIPSVYWDDILQGATGFTGYSHQWQNLTNENRGIMRYCMASVDSTLEKIKAQSLGYRTFRVTQLGNKEILSGEFICPASVEAGQKITCVDCLACHGGIDSRKASPVIQIHGILKKRFNQVQKMQA